MHNWGVNLLRDLVSHGNCGVGRTVVPGDFGHRNWREVVEATYHCSMKWATFLLSLREYVETGEGKPSPHDLKIDNWN